jgi:energy-coupling factor transport system permease protein
MDALSKFAWILLLGVFGYVISYPLALAVLVVLVHVVAFGVARVPWPRYARAAPYFFLLGICTGFFQVLIRSRGGDVIADVGPFAITTGGLSFGATFGLRVTLIAFASLVFIWTTDPRDLVIALIYLRTPYRIAYGVFVALRFVPLIENEAMVIREAQAVRGVREVSSKLEAAKRYVMPLLVSGIRRAEHMAIAMDSRAFGAFPRRTFVHDFGWTRSGLVLVATFVAVGALLVWYSALLGGLFER